MCIHMHAHEIHSMLFVGNPLMDSGTWLLQPVLHWIWELSCLKCWFQFFWRYTQSWGCESSVSLLVFSEPSVLFFHGDCTNIRLSSIQHSFYSPSCRLDHCHSNTCELRTSCDLFCLFEIDQFPKPCWLFWKSSFEKCLYKCLLILKRYLYWNSYKEINKNFQSTGSLLRWPQ